MNTLAQFEGVDWISIGYALIALAVVLLIGSTLFSQIKSRLSKKYLCAIAINKDPSLTKTAPSGTSLLTALRANGVYIPSPCNSKGTCKQCRVQIDAHAPPPTKADKASFDLRKLKQGWRLACQARMREDIHINIDAKTFDVREYSGKVLSNENVATFIKELVVQLDPREKIVYSPGSYVQFHVPPFKTDTGEWKHTIPAKYVGDWEKNAMLGHQIDFGHLATGPESSVCAFSMASYPAEGNVLKFNIRIATPQLAKGKLTEALQWGICSSYAFSLQPGDTVRFSGPYGEAFMPDDQREVIFLVGGAGSSFGRSHIMHLFHSQHTKRQVTLWYGARSLREIIYHDDFEELAKNFPNFNYHLVLSEPLADDIADGWPADDPLKTNLLFRAFEAGQLKALEAKHQCLFFVCGPPLHNKSVMDLLDSYGTPKENIILDDFGI